jgi:hypothetical protein
MPNADSNTLELAPPTKQNHNTTPPLNTKPLPAEALAKEG